MAEVISITVNTSRVRVVRLRLLIPLSPCLPYNESRLVTWQTILWLIAITPPICANTFSSCFELELCHQPVVYKGATDYQVVDTYDVFLKSICQELYS